MALGLIEVYGFATSILCADAAAKAAEVTIVALDKNKPNGGDSVNVPLIMQVKIRGGVEEVRSAVEAGSCLAKEKGMLVMSHVITREAEDTKKMAALCDVGKDSFNSRPGSVKLKRQ
jgi:microcompartment protein CcmL/EutN